MRRARYQILISVLLFLHFTGVILWILPASSMQERLVQPFIPYINYFGLWQNWCVFVSPHTVNVYMSADIKYKDGSVSSWEFPRMDKMGILEKMYKERYRQWGTDAVSDDTMPMLRPDAARFIARLHNTEAGNPPVSVRIVRHWTYIPAPIDGLGKPLPEEEDGEEVVYDGDINPEDLR